MKDIILCAVLLLYGLLGYFLMRRLDKSMLKNKKDKIKKNDKSDKK